MTKRTYSACRDPPSSGCWITPRNVRPHDEGLCPRRSTPVTVQVVRVLPHGIEHLLTVCRSGRAANYRLGGVLGQYIFQTVGTLRNFQPK